MTWLASERRTTGTVICEGVGGAVSAATWAGERIWRAAIQPSAASAMRDAKVTAAVRWREPVIPGKSRMRANTAHAEVGGERGVSPRHRPGSELTMGRCACALAGEQLTRRVALRGVLVNDYGRATATGKGAMSRTIRRRLIPSPSMVVACIALGVAIGGTSYAALRIPARSIGSKQLKSNAITGAKVVDNSLTGSDINESTLEGIKAAGFEKLFYKTAQGPVIAPAPSPDNPSVGTVTASCDDGMRAIGGGTKLENPAEMETVDGFPDAGSTVWTVHVANGDTTAPHTFIAYAICAPTGSNG